MLMKLATLLLLLLNLLGLALWQGWLPRPAGPVPVPVPVQVRPSFVQAPQRLVLLSELAPEQLALMQQVAESRERAASAQARLDVAEEEALATRAQLAAAPPAGLVVSPRPWCATAGAFADEAVAGEFRTVIADLGGAAELISRDEPVSSTWWVYLPAFRSEAEARAELAELQGKGIDSYYMRTGELAGGISLGVFSREESARIARQQLAGRGYDASIQEIFRYNPRYYVDVTLPDGSLRSRPEWSRTEPYMSALQYTENACQVIAPENQFP